MTGLDKGLLPRFSFTYLHTLSGKLSNWAVRLLKNLVFSALSLICISSRNKSESTKSFLKNPPGFLQRVMISAGLGRVCGDALTNSMYNVDNAFGIYE